MIAEKTLIMSMVERLEAEVWMGEMEEKIEDVESVNNTFPTGWSLKIYGVL